MNSKFDDLVRSLDPQTLEELKRSVVAELGGRREETAIQIEQIHPENERGRAGRSGAGDWPGAARREPGCLT